MSDKDLLVVISEMLRKQDQHSAILNQHSEILNEHTGLLNNQKDAINQQSVTINELKDTLKQFNDISVQHFEKQDGFNTQFLSRLDEISKKP